MFACFFFLLREVFFARSYDWFLEDHRPLFALGCCVCVKGWIFEILKIYKRWWLGWCAEPVLFELLPIEGVPEEGQRQRNNYIAFLNHLPNYFEWEPVWLIFIPVMGFLLWAVVHSVAGFVAVFYCCQCWCCCWCYYCCWYYCCCCCRVMQLMVARMRFLLKTTRLTATTTGSGGFNTDGSSIKIIIIITKTLNEWKCRFVKFRFLGWWLVIWCCMWFAFALFQSCFDWAIWPLGSIC